MAINRKFHDVEVIQTGQDALSLRVDGQVIRIAWTNCSVQLAEASAIEREIIEIALSGYGLHWPLLDEDLAIGPLLAHAQVVDVSALAVR